MLNTNYVFIRPGGSKQQEHFLGKLTLILQ